MVAALKYQLFLVGVLVWLSGSFANAKNVHRPERTTASINVTISSAVVTGNATTTVDSTDNVPSTELPSKTTITDHPGTPRRHRPKVTTVHTDVSDTTTSVVAAAATSIITGPASLLPPTLVIPASSHARTIVVYSTSSSLPSTSDISSSAVRSTQHGIGAAHLGLVAMGVGAGVLLL